MSDNYNLKVVELKQHLRTFNELKIPVILSKEQKNAQLYAKIVRAW